MKWMLASALLLSACATDADQSLGIANPRASFRVETMPAGATASVTYGDVTAPRVIACTTPCELSVPTGQNFRFQIVRAGYSTLPFTPPRWRMDVLRGWMIEPSTITVNLQER